MYVRVNESIYNPYAISILFDYETWGLVELAPGGFQPLQLPALVFHPHNKNSHQAIYNMYVCVYDTYTYIYLYCLKAL